MLLPWAPGEGRGWARKGRSWLRLNGVSVSGGYEVFPYRLETHRFFTVSTPDGKRYPATKAAIEVSSAGLMGTYGVYFDVPETLRTGTLTIDPVAGLRRSAREPMKWISKPKGGSFPIELAA